jgi:predicted GTPase
MMKLLQQQIRGIVKLLSEPLLEQACLESDGSSLMAEWCETLKEQMASASQKASRAAFRVAVIGPMKAGKSTTTNAMVSTAISTSE